MTPRISLVAYADRNPAFIFVAVPNQRGRYLRTDPCVIRVPCEVCGAAVGEPCHNGGEIRVYHVNTHYVRRKLADQRRRRGAPVKPRYRLVNGSPVLVNEGAP